MKKVHIKVGQAANGGKHKVYSSDNVEIHVEGLEDVPIQRLKFEVDVDSYTPLLTLVVVPNEVEIEGDCEVVVNS